MHFPTTKMAPTLVKQQKSHAPAQLNYIVIKTPAYQKIIQERVQKIFLINLCPPRTGL